jgi:hypothetical protein
MMPATKQERKPTMTTETPEKNGKPPVATLRDGLLYAKIWERQTENGAFYSVSFERRYKGKDEQWASAFNFNRDDLLGLAKLADQAHTEIARLQEKAAA